ncbi:myrosinase 1-like [Diachasmimorpha longicaudata]|uniref:myrosinase 1-like n=1 Tax=Diachasmimorpha longicaudata TaxID=58733 RepID=UPI0030B8E039
MGLWKSVIILWILPGILAEDIYLRFPPGFTIGTSSAAYQIEGGWNASDKGQSVWDAFTHEKDWIINDRSNGDIACDSYHKYKEDVDILQNIGVHHYRFSLSWTRILPTGLTNHISQDGLRYYKNLISELRSKGIEPFVTIYHWDHPEFMSRLGSWTNELMIEWLVDYARVVFRELGPSVKFWTTVNEPNNYCEQSYAGSKQAPGMDLPFFANYLCLHNLLKAHARVYQVYNEEFRAEQKGKIGIVIPCRHNFPKNENDTETAKIAFDFDCGWAANPIFSEDGDYPAVMKQRIKENSELEGLSFSRLPEFSPDWIKLIRGSSDYFGLNHYTSKMVEPVRRINGTAWYQDSGIRSFANESWPGCPTDWLRIVPEGLGGVLRDIKEAYNNTPVYILENGVSSLPGIHDYSRIDYLYSYMKSMLEAINRDGCDVKAYTVWSLLDNFEWDRGYTERFGLVEVDFNHPNRTRTPRLSTKWLRQIIAEGKLIKYQDMDFSSSQLPTSSATTLLPIFPVIFSLISFRLTLM